MFDWIGLREFTGNHRFSHEIWGFPADFPLNQSIEYWNFRGSKMDETMQKVKNDVLLPSGKLTC